MAYTAWSVVFGEQPTAAKWNQLGANDAGFKDGTNIDNNAIINRHIAEGVVASEKLHATLAFRAHRASNQTLSAAVFNKILFSNEDWDYGSDFDLSTNRFVAPVDGLYHFDFRGVAASGSRGLATFYKNGVEVTRGADVEGVTNPRGRMCSADIELLVGDYIEFYVYSLSAGAASGSSHELWATGHLVGEI